VHDLSADGIYHVENQGALSYSPMNSTAIAGAFHYGSNEIKITVDGHLAAQSLRIGWEQRRATVRENFSSLACTVEMRGNLIQALWACNVILHSRVADAVENDQHLNVFFE